MSDLTSPDFCWSHYRLEPSDEQTFQVCFECNHVYQGASDLVMAYRLAREEMSPLMTASEAMEGWICKASDITFCQYCLHDF